MFSISKLITKTRKRDQLSNKKSIQAKNLTKNSLGTNARPAKKSILTRNRFGKAR